MSTATDFFDACILAAVKQRTKDNPIPLARLAVEVGLGERATKQHIQNLRRDGKPIAVNRSRNNGYYWDATGAEAARIANEGFSRLVTARGMRNSQGARENTGQERLI